MWLLDIEIPLKHTGNEYYGENGGPGGFFHTMRQVPITLEIACDIEQLCPDAWFVNMANPESRLCLALERYSNVKNVGVCLGAYITKKTLATTVLGLKDEDVDLKAAGINHCHWVMDIRHTGTGEDLYPHLLEKMDAMDPEWQPLSQECLRRFGTFPGPGDTHVGEYIGWAHKFFPPNYASNRVRAFGDGERAMEARMEAVASGDGPLGPDELEAFMAESGYKWQTLDIILSLLDSGNRYVLSVNIPNDGTISNLKRGAIIEVPAIVGADRIYGLGMGELPSAIAAMMDLQLTIMELNIEAAVTGDRQTALQGLMIDPLVPDPATAEKILDDMLVAQAHLLPQFQ
jgi:alpha-galactosidase